MTTCVKFTNKNLAELDGYTVSRQDIEEDKQSGEAGMSRFTLRDKTGFVGDMTISKRANGHSRVDEIRVVREFADGNTEEILRKHAEELFPNININNKRAHYIA